MAKTPTVDRAMEWIAEADYITRTAEVNGKVPEMNNDPATFVRYCEMQQRAAQREGFTKIAENIAQNLIDLRAALDTDCDARGVIRAHRAG